RNLPGIVHSTFLVKGTRCSSGRRQLVRPIPASAIDAPINFKKSRRDHSSPFSSAEPGGNSRSNHCRNSGVSFNSPRLRQYFVPVDGSGGWWKICFIGGTPDNL